MEERGQRCSYSFSSFWTKGTLSVSLFLSTYLIYEDLELAVVSSDADVDVVSLLVGIALALFLAPFSLGEGVANDLKKVFWIRFNEKTTFPSSKRTLI